MPFEQFFGLDVEGVGVDDVGLPPRQFRPSLSQLLHDLVILLPKPFELLFQGRQLRLHFAGLFQCVCVRGHRLLVSLPACSEVCLQLLHVLQVTWFQAFQVGNFVLNSNDRPLVLRNLHERALELVCQVFHLAIERIDAVGGILRKLRGVLQAQFCFLQRRSNFRCSDLSGETKDVLSHLLEGFLGRPKLVPRSSRFALGHLFANHFGFDHLGELFHSWKLPRRFRHDSTPHHEHPDRWFLSSCNSNVKRCPSAAILVFQACSLHGQQVNDLCIASPCGSMNCRLARAVGCIHVGIPIDQSCDRIAMTARSRRHERRSTVQVSGLGVRFMCQEGLHNPRKAPFGSFVQRGEASARNRFHVATTG
mmetsp:Transcript_35703/g.77121  ORF Transcript_35703/g.77121 Transcript_35703/m.77121 type:complete len:364 (-) Transcript_35703:272-1363(-)